MSRVILYDRGKRGNGKMTIDENSDPSLINQILFCNLDRLSSPWIGLPILEPVHLVYTQIQDQNSECTQEPFQRIEETRSQWNNHFNLLSSQMNYHNKIPNILYYLHFTKGGIDSVSQIIYNG